MLTTSPGPQNINIPTWYKDKHLWLINFSAAPDANNIELSCDPLYEGAKNFFICLSIEEIDKDKINPYANIHNKFKCNGNPTVFKNNIFLIKNLNDNIEILLELVKQNLLPKVLFLKIFASLKSCPVHIPNLFRAPNFGWMKNSNDNTNEEFSFSIMNLPHADRLEVCYHPSDQSVFLSIFGIATDTLEAYENILKSSVVNYQIDKTENSLVLVYNPDNSNIFKEFLKAKLLPENIVNNIELSLSSYTNVPTQYLSNYRNEFIIDIPVRSKDINDFKNDAKHIFNDIYKFVKNELIKLDCNSRKINSFWIQELVKNSIDSYFAKGLKEGEKFILKIVIKKVNHDIFIKIKDNATGFLNQKRGSYFHLNQITYQEKSEKNYYYGGQRQGLKLFEDYVHLKNGALRLKNRKEVGAAIEVVFKP